MRRDRSRRGAPNAHSNAESTRKGQQLPFHKLVKFYSFDQTNLGVRGFG